MPITVERITNASITIFGVVGEILFDEVMAVMENMYTGTPTLHVMWDFSSLDSVGLSTEELRTILGYIKRRAAGRAGGRTALLAHSDFIFGLSRMAATIAELDAVPFSIKAFRTRDEAMIWLETGE